MIRFLYEPDLLDGPSGAGRLYHHQIYAQMANAHTATVRPNLTSRFGFSLMPRPWEINVYFAHRRSYPAPSADGETAVFFGHGIADKGWRTAGRIRDFHFVCTSGPAWTDRYLTQGVHPDRILEIGYPKLDPIFNGEIEPRQRDRRIRVVWAPTHGGVIGRPLRDDDPSRNAASSWRHRDLIMGLLEGDDFDVVEAPHPRTRPDRKITLAEYVDADVVIADGGSTIYEAWALGLPVVFPTWLTSVSRRHQDRSATFEADIYRWRIGRHVFHPADLAGAVVEAAAEGITTAEVDFIAPILPSAYRGTSGRRFARMLDDISAGTRLPPQPEERSMPTNDRVLLRHDGIDETIEVTERRARVLARSGWVEVTPTSEPIPDPAAPAADRSEDDSDTHQPTELVAEPVTYPV